MSSAVGTARRRPGGLASLMVDAGRWSPGEALERLRWEDGRHHPEALAQLCPRLSDASVTQALQDCVLHPPDARELDMVGLAAVLGRLRERPGARDAYWTLPPAHRVHVAAAVAPADPKAIVDDAFAQAEPWWPPYDVTTGLLNLLPWVPEAEREARVSQAIDLLLGDEPDEEYPTEPHHLGRIARVDPALALRWASRAGGLTYPFLQDRAHIAAAARGTARDEVLEQWLGTLETADPQESSLRGNCIPTPMPVDARRRLLTIVDARAGRWSFDGAAAERAYVLVRLAPEDPDLIPAARGAIERLSGFSLAMAGLALAPLLGDAERVARLDESLSILRGYGRDWPPRFLTAQQGWLGEDRRTRMLDDFCVEAVRRMPPDRRGPYLDRLERP